MESKPSGVSRSGETKQGGDVRARWAWAEPAVWTDRMLAALERGVKGDVWFSLMDKVFAERNLASAFARVARNKGGSGVDGVSVAAFGKRVDSELSRLRQQLREDEYTPQAIRRAYIPKGDGKRRPLGIPTVRDRVVQTALRNVLEPIFERTFAEHSYGFRPQRSAKGALERVQALLDAGYCHVVDADIQGYFDSIPKDKLLALVREKVSDGRVLRLLEQFLNQPVLEGLESWTPDQGTPQGAVISPLLANIYLNPLDHLMADADIAMVRYADDFVVLCRDPSDAAAALELIRGWMQDAGLVLHPEKTRIVSMEEVGSYFDFLGYRFKRCTERLYRFPRPKSAKALRARVRAKTRRNHGHSLEHIIAELNPILRGWFQYFQLAHDTSFPKLDGYVRMRLRSILRQRHKGKGRGGGYDHFRWPNAFFAKHGLFCLTAARAQIAQPHSG